MIIVSYQLCLRRQNIVLRNGKELHFLVLLTSNQFRNSLKIDSCNKELDGLCHIWEKESWRVFPGGPQKLWLLINLQIKCDKSNRLSASPKSHFVFTYSHHYPNPVVAPSLLLQISSALYLNPVFFIPAVIQDVGICESPRRRGEGFINETYFLLIEFILKVGRYTRGFMLWMPYLYILDKY